MHILVTCKNEDDLIENEGSKVATTLSPLNIYGDFSRRSRVFLGFVNFYMYYYNCSDVTFCFSLQGVGTALGPYIYTVSIYKPINCNRNQEDLVDDLIVN